MSSKSTSLADKSIAAVKWNYLGVIVRVVSQILAQIILARLLGPESFGLFAAAILIVGVGSIIVEMGLGSALVQKKDLQQSDIRFAFTWVCTAGLAMAIAVFCAAGLVGAFFDDPRITDVLRGLTPVFILQALSVVPSALLRRELAFKAVQVVQVISYVGGFLVIGVISAALGAGVWSLVAAWIGQSALAAIILYSIRRHPVRPLYIHDATLFRGFGSRVLFTNLTNWAIENTDNVIVGRFFGPAALGLYSVSYNLVRNPTNHLVSTLQAVLFPTCANAQDNMSGLRRAYLTVLSAVSLIVFPLFAAIATVPETVVSSLFGSQWVDAAPVLTPLAIAMILHALMAIAGPVLWGRGRAGTELKVQIVVAGVFIVALLLASQYSLTVVAWAVCAVYGLRMLSMTVAIASNIQIKLADILRVMRGGVIGAGLMVGTLVIFDQMLVSVPPGLRLAVEVFLSLSLIFIYVVVFPRLSISDELVWVLQRIAAGNKLLAHSTIMQRIYAGRSLISVAGVS